MEDGGEALKCMSLDPPARSRILVCGKGHLVGITVCKNTVEYRLNKSLKTYQHRGECSNHRGRFDKAAETSVHGVGNGGQSLVQVQSLFPLTFSLVLNLELKF